MAIKNSNKLKETLDRQPFSKKTLDRMNAIEELISPEFAEQFKKIKKKVEITVLNNPGSENDVVKYLTGVRSKLDKILLFSDVKKQMLINGAADGYQEERVA